MQARAPKHSQNAFASSRYDTATAQKRHSIPADLFGTYAIVFVAQNLPKQSQQLGRLGDGRDGINRHYEYCNCIQYAHPERFCKRLRAAYRLFDGNRFPGLFRRLAWECEDRRSETSRQNYR
jgi:hypothetical protein